MSAPNRTDKIMSAAVQIELYAMAIKGEIADAVFQEIPQPIVDLLADADAIVSSARAAQAVTAAIAE